ncbi:hypothetical protein [Xanthomonas citri]|uniref:hypothetical protein n=1 Tax=Xanthomonas citri TaxID=346 RepID=UPI000C411CFF|nr:hypothetical protein [Xanthomonas citri]SOO14175.1 hypothetical protein XFF7766_280039 [Xanthomonas citri pv. fuscans]
MRRLLQQAAVSSPNLTLLHASVLNSTGGELSEILSELADVGRECFSFLTALLGHESFASSEFEMSRLHAQMLWMLLGTTFSDSVISNDREKACANA